MKTLSSHLVTRKFNSSIRFLQMFSTNGKCPCRALVRTAMRSEFSIHTNKSACATPARGSALRQRRTEPEAPKPYVKARSRSRPREKVAMARVASRCSDSKSGGWRVLYTPALYCTALHCTVYYCCVLLYTTGSSLDTTGRLTRLLMFVTVHL